MSIAKDLSVDLIELSTSKPDQLKGVLSNCMNDPAFMDAFRRNNKDLMEKMDELSSDANGAVTGKDFLKNSSANMSSEEKRLVLKNGIEQKLPIAKFLTNFFVGIDTDPSEAKIAKLASELVKAIEDQGNQAEKDK